MFYSDSLYTFAPNHKYKCMESILLNGLTKQRQLYVDQIKDLEKKVSAIDMLLSDQSQMNQKTSTVSTVIEDYPFKTPMSRRVMYVINQGGEWKVDEIVKFISDKENTNPKGIKPVITMTASALYRSGKVNARKDGIINIYSKKED